MMLLQTSITLMITAAVVSSLCVFRIRPSGWSSVSPGSPCTSGMTATPVSNPDRPSASFGKTSKETTTILNGLPYSATVNVFQTENEPGCAQRW